MLLAIALTWGLPRCAGTSAGSILATYLATKGEYLSPTLLPPGMRKGRHLHIHSETCGTSHRSGVEQAEEFSVLQPRCASLRQRQAKPPGIPPASWIPDLLHLSTHCTLARKAYQGLAQRQ